MRHTNTEPYSDSTRIFSDFFYASPTKSKSCSGFCLVFRKHIEELFPSNNWWGHLFLTVKRWAELLLTVTSQIHKKHVKMNKNKSNAFHWIKLEFNLYSLHISCTNFTVVWTVYRFYRQKLCFFSIGTSYKIWNKCLHGAFALKCKGDLL